MHERNPNRGPDELRRQGRDDMAGAVEAFRQLRHPFGYIEPLPEPVISAEDWQNVSAVTTGAKK